MKGLVVRKGQGQSYETGPALFKAGGGQTGGRYDFMIMDLEYHTGPQLHVHEQQEDTFFVLAGVLTVQLGDEVHELHPGDFASAPPGLPHTFDNLVRDQGAVRVINLMTPGGYEGLFAEFDKLQSDPESQEALALYAKYSAALVGPTLREHLENR